MGFVVNRKDLAAIPGTHGGTGLQQSTNWVVDPASVPGSGNLAFNGLNVEVTTLLFEIADAVVPNWFGVALPRGIADFTRPHIFFHPTPGQTVHGSTGYIDADYPTKAGDWPKLFYYMERLGYQLDAARRGQVLIMPFLTEARKDTGILVTDWQDIVTQILTQVRALYDPSDSSALAISQLVVSSFSAGIIYSHNFRTHAAGVSDVLAEIWDFDGRFSSYHTISEALHSTAQVQVHRYDQLFSADSSAVHVPIPRWSKLVNPPSTMGDVHALIRDFMFLDAASVSGVGALLPGPASSADDTAFTAATHTASGTAGSASTAFTGTPILPGGTGDTATVATTGTALGTFTFTLTGTATTGDTGAPDSGGTDGGGSGTTTQEPPAPAPQPPTPPEPPSPPEPPQPPEPPTPPQAPVEPPPVPAQPAPYPAPPHQPPPPQPPDVPAAPYPPETPAPRPPFGPAPMPPAYGWPPLPPPPAPYPVATSCGCETAIVAISATVAATSQTALTAITALARRRPR